MNLIKQLNLSLNQIFDKEKSRLERLVSLIPIIGELNRIFSNVVAGRGISCEDAVAVASFVNSKLDAKLIDAELVNIVINHPADKRQLLINRLNNSLTKIITTFNDYRPLFDNADLPSLWQSQREEVIRCIDEQLHRLRDLSPELNEVNNSLEMSPFNGRPQSEVYALERQFDRLKAEYDAEKQKLTDLYDRQKAIECDMQSVDGPIFSIAASRCADLLSIVEKYVETNPSGTVDESVADEEPPIAYLPMALISEVFKEVNGEQFENMSEPDFFHAINLHQAIPAIRIVDGERNRAYYVIHKFGERVDEKLRQQWITGILEQLGVKRSTYASKYRKVVSDDASVADKEFVDVIDTVFKR